MKTWMFYSYKGGSGRTVATANVAAALTKLGKRVAVVDLDFEAPGLQHVFGAEDTDQYANGVGIQQYLLGERDFEELNSLGTIDMFGPHGPLRGNYVPKDALLLYVIASPGVSALSDRAREVSPKMRALLDELGSKHNLDVVIIDAASGLRTAFEVAINVSDEMLIFFRWSTQHVEGTIKVAKLMKMMREFQTGRPIPFKLVASAVPEIEDIKKEPESISAPLLQRIGETHEKISKTLKDCQANPAEVFHKIDEKLALKWREKVIVFEQEDSDYEQLAKKLIASL